MKKKILAAVLSVCLLLPLCACGKGAKKTETGSFEGTSSQLVIALRKDLVYYGYEDMFQEDPEPEAIPESGNAPEGLCRRYLTQGISFEVYSLKETDEVYEAILKADKNALATQKDQEALTLMIDLVTDAFEQKEREELFEALSLPDVNDGIDKQAKGTIADWKYSVVDGQLVLRATSVEYLESTADKSGS